MPIALVGKIAKGPGRALIPALHKAGFSPNQIYKQLKNVYKMSWRKQDMLADIRQVTGLMKHERQWDGFDPSRKPGRWLFNDVPLRAKENYRLYADINTFNVLSGDYDTRRISFYIDKFDSPDDAMKQYIRFLEKKYKVMDEQILSYRFLTGEHNRGNPW